MDDATVALRIERHASQPGGQLACSRRYAPESLSALRPGPR
jgi:hypothetical protein